LLKPAKMNIFISITPTAGQSNWWLWSVWAWYSWQARHLANYFWLPCTSFLFWWLQVLLYHWTSFFRGVSGATTCYFDTFILSLCPWSSIVHLAVTSMIRIQCLFGDNFWISVLCTGGKDLGCLLKWCQLWKLRPARLCMITSKLASLNWRCGISQTIASLILSFLLWSLSMATLASSFMHLKSLVWMCHFWCIVNLNLFLFGGYILWCWCSLWNEVW